MTKSAMTESAMNVVQPRGAAVVTGGVGGIGSAVLQRLRQDGYRAVSWDLVSNAPLADLALAVDVTDDAALANAARDTVDRAGPIEALVINAGILGPVGPAWEATPMQIRQVLEVNLTSAFLTVRAVIPHMLGNKGPDRGRVVIVSSVQAKEGTALAGPYAASKAGLIALAKCLGKELAAEGILVNAITPTVVRTNMEQSISAERRADLLSRIPLGRFMESREVAELVSWLCSAQCSFSTGAVFDLSGGRSPY